ncbi:hypothetical protein RI129_006154 [Pyrocoelia pectoralis]|uniref:Uncharacterized protein n=1 Tax=Pyrocoelia pectoralis TaxID=417401 RepID=A0AAN7VJN5_9COLE
MAAATSNHIIVFIFAVLTLFSAVVCKIITVDNNCGKSPNKDKCKIHEVRIDPCQEAETKKPCKVKRGKSGNIEIDYTPRRVKKGENPNISCNYVHISKQVMILFFNASPRKWNVMRCFPPK